MESVLILKMWTKFRTFQDLKMQNKWKVSLECLDFTVFCEELCKNCIPIDNLAEERWEIKMDTRMSKCFWHSQEQLTTAPILTFPQLDQLFILTTDASDFSMAYILSQIQDSREHVIAYGGRALKGSELKWHITDKEALALVEGIQHFKHYLSN